MANWYYFTETREKIGPITGKELKRLVLQGTVTPETFVEDPQGRTGLAKDVNGLTFPEPTSVAPPVLENPSSIAIPPAPEPPVPVPQPSTIKENHLTTNWYYYNANGEKVGPLKSADIKTLASQGVIRPETVVENDSGLFATMAKNVLTFSHGHFGKTAIMSCAKFMEGIVNNHWFLSINKFSTQPRNPTVDTIVVVAIVAFVLMFVRFPGLCANCEGSGKALSAFSNICRECNGSGAATVWKHMNP